MDSPSNGLITKYSVFGTGVSGQLGGHMGTFITGRSMRTRSSAARPRKPRLYLHIKLAEHGAWLPRVEEIRPTVTTMKLIFAIFFAILALVRSQYYGFNDFPSNAFSGGLDTPYQSTRDPRQNRGPVVFPQAPPDNGETSGVIVGASGYGFVAPRSRSFY